MATLLDYATALEGLVRRYVFLATQLDHLVRAGGTSRQKIGYLATEFEDVHSRAREFRKSFDEIQGSDFATPESPAANLELWNIEKEIRTRVTSFAGAVMRAARVAARLRDQDANRIMIGKDGDTYQSIALQELGDWQAWTQLADANRDVAPEDDLRGKVIKIPGIDSGGASTTQI